MSSDFTYPNQPLPWNAGPQDYTGDNNVGLSTNDATQRFTLGTRHISWDGSVYKYIKAGTAFTSYQMGVYDEATGAAVSYEALGAASAKGSNVVTMTQGSITDNQYSGGHMTIFHATGGGEVYTIMGNDATSGTITTFYLDRPLAVALTTSDYVELWANHYSAVAQGNSGGTQGFLGVPMALLTDTYYGWVKTRGPAFVAPQSTVGNAYMGAAYWRHDGSVDAFPQTNAALTGYSAPMVTTSQYAGYVMAGDASGDGPLIMLQGSY